MKKSNLVAGALIGIFSLSLLAGPVFAVDPDKVIAPPTPSTTGGELGVTATGVYNNLLKWAGWIYTIILTVAILYFAYGGIKYLTAGGDETKTKTARRQVLNGVVGIAVIIGVGWVIFFIAGTFLGSNASLSDFLPWTKVD